MLRLDPNEVAEAFEVPLSVIVDPANPRRDSRYFNGKDRYFYVFPYQDRYIWGVYGFGETIDPIREIVNEELRRGQPSTRD